MVEAEFLITRLLGGNITICMRQTQNPHQFSDSHMSCTPSFEKNSDGHTVTELFELQALYRQRH